MIENYCDIFQIDYSNIGLKDFLYSHLPEKDYRRIFIKPNWVQHEIDNRFPIRAIVTSSDLIDTVIDLCLNRYPNLDKITIGDAPLQSCRWNLLSAQSGVDRLKQKYEHHKKPLVSFLDLRKERYLNEKGFLYRDSESAHSDPKGYRSVILENESLLDPISQVDNRFCVSDYDRRLTTMNQRKGHHRYLISGSVLDSDLFINMPKLKTHQKAGITGSLKNLVGINGDKACLVHHRIGLPEDGGDEFPSDISRLLLFQTRIRDVLQKRNKYLFAFGRKAWKSIKLIYGIRTDVVYDGSDKGIPYIGAGSWYGNDTIWRMIYDLNMIVRYSPSGGGTLSFPEQRDYLSIVDGIVSGEGNGPLQVVPVDLGIVAVADNPFVLDIGMARLMGFDYEKIPSLRNHNYFRAKGWGDIDPHNQVYHFNDCVFKGVNELPVLRRFLAPPGWLGHIELDL